MRADLWLICDGPVDQSGRQAVQFGARGDTHLEITIYRATRPLHSGHYGNWAPNPAMMIVQLLAGIKYERGHVRIPGFYDGVEPLGPAERKALSRAPIHDEELRRELGLGHVDGGDVRLLELLKPAKSGNPGHVFGSDRKPRHECHPELGHSRPGPSGGCRF